MPDPIHLIVGAYLVWLVGAAIHHCVTFNPKTDFSLSAWFRSWNL